MRPATRKGGIQFDRAAVTRAAVYTLLQGVFGQVSPVATELAKAATPAQLDTILGAERPQLKVAYRGLNYSIELDAAYFAQVRARMAEIPL